MNALKVRAFRGALDALYLSRVYRLMQRTWSGCGAIFMLHRVLPEDGHGEFAPNRYLALTPEFLDTVLTIAKEADRDIIGLDEVPQRLRENGGRRFVCFTFDDGYRDVFDHALPVFQKHGAPFALYLNTGMPDGTALLWWDLLEELFRRADTVAIGDARFEARTLPEKRKGFRDAYWHLRTLTEAQRRDEVRKLCDTHGIDTAEYCRASAMTWDMVEEMHGTGLASIEAHTVTHPLLTQLEPDQVCEEADRSRAIIAERLGTTPRHFAYPYGNAAAAGPREFALIRDLGFATATTTRKGTVFPLHAEHLHALPRVSLNGDYQAARYVRLFLSGAPFAFWQKFRKLDVD